MDATRAEALCTPVKSSDRLRLCALSVYSTDDNCGTPQGLCTPMMKCGDGLRLSVLSVHVCSLFALFCSCLRMFALFALGCACVRFVALVCSWLRVFAHFSSWLRLFALFFIIGPVRILLSQPATPALLRRGFGSVLRLLYICGSSGCG